MADITGQAVSVQFLTDAGWQDIGEVSDDIVYCDGAGDGGIDIVVANDTVQNLLFRNRGDGTFEDVGAPAGIAFDVEGNARGAMG